MILTFSQLANDAWQREIPGAGNGWSCSCRDPVDVQHGGDTVGSVPMLSREARGGFYS